VTIDFFLDRKLQDALREQLATMPHLVEELAITIARKSRTSNRLGRPHHPKPSSKPPLNVDAQYAADELHNTLVTATRLVCEERQIHYNDTDDDLSLARWLRTNMIQLALCEAAEEIAAEIAGKMDACSALIDLPPEDLPYVNANKVREANRQVLTADHIEKIAPKLGPLGAGLNKRRVQTLLNSGRLERCDLDSSVALYRLGDVLDAHHRHARRQKKA